MPAYYETGVWAAGEHTLAGKSTAELPFNLAPNCNMMLKFVHDVENTRWRHD